MGAGCTIPLTRKSLINIQVSTPKKIKKKPENRVIDQSPQSLLSAEKKKKPHFDFSLPLERSTQKMYEIGEYLFKFTNTTKKMRIWSKMECDGRDYQTYYKKRPLNFIKRVYNGPPQSVRWFVWNTFSQSQGYFAKGIYESLLSQISPFENDIQKDIFRTFPRHSFFMEIEMTKVLGEELHEPDSSNTKDLENKPSNFNIYDLHNTFKMKETNTMGHLAENKGNIKLFRILKAISIMFPNIGYCQGMNFLLGFFLLISGGNELECFWLFVSLVKNEDFLISGFYENGFPLLKLYSFIFYKILEKKSKKLFLHIKNSDLPDSLWLQKWLLTGFVFTNPLEIAVRFWDFILASKSLFSLVNIAFGIVKIFENQILEKDSMEIAEFFRVIHESTEILLDRNTNVFIDVEKLIENIKKIKIKKTIIAKYTKEYIQTLENEEEKNNKYLKIYEKYGEKDANIKKKKNKNNKDKENQNNSNIINENNERISEKPEELKENNKNNLENYENINENNEHNEIENNKENEIIEEYKTDNLKNNEDAQVNNEIIKRNEEQESIEANNKFFVINQEITEKNEEINENNQELIENNQELIEENEEIRDKTPVKSQNIIKFTEESPMKDQ